MTENLNSKIVSSPLSTKKKVIKSMAGVSSRMPCRQLFKELNILTLASLNII
jgi:hypothetical protein